MDDLTDQDVGQDSTEKGSSDRVIGDQIDEVAATGVSDAELSQNVGPISAGVKVREFSKRKLLISLSALILLIVIGLIGTRYYSNYQDKQRTLAVSKAALDSALTASKAKFDSAQLAIAPNSYKDAINDLKNVIPADPHYAQAQKQIAILNNVSDIASLILTLNTDRAKFDSALTQFYDNYESLRGPMNSASQYPYPGTTPVAMSYIGKADTIYSGLSTSTESVNESVTAISNDLGSITSNTYLSSFSNTAQTLSSFQDISNQVSSIKAACRDYLESLKNNYLDYTLVSKANSSRDKLGEDTINVKQGISALTGFANGKVNDLLKDAAQLNK